MLKYKSVKGNTEMIFINKKSALDHATENLGHIYKECNEWKYYNPRSRSRWASYITIGGDNIEEAIESSFSNIAEQVGMGMYTLNSVSLTDNHDGTATLNIVAWATNSAKVGFKQSMLTEENKKSFKLEILDVVDGDIPNGKIEFEIKERVGR